MASVLELYRKYDPNIQNNSLQDFLPYNPELKSYAALRTSLNEYLLLILAAISAFQDFKDKKYEKFDPLVGENACQIRAIKLILIAKKGIIDSLTFISRAKKIEQEIKKILYSKEIEHLMMNGESLLEVLFQKNLIIELKNDEWFLIASWILTIVKEPSNKDQSYLSLFLKERTEPKKIQHLGSVSSAFANNLISKLRKELSIDSVEFIKKHSYESGSFDGSLMLSDLYTVVHNGHLLCIPMFWSYKVILSIIKKFQIPVIFKVKLVKASNHNFCLIQEGSISSNEIRYFNNSTYHNHKCPSLIIEGIAVSDEENLLKEDSWKNTISQHSPYNVILAGAADHRQYPDDNIEKIFNLDLHSEFSWFKKYALSEGFSLNNPSNFFIQHVYCNNNNDGQ